MASKDDSILGLCTRATLLGNNISVRMLEFLTTVKSRPHGLSKLAHEFLDICRVLWSIEAGLEECARTHQRFPTDMVKELDTRFRQTIIDFQSLDGMLFKFLEYEKKGAVGKIQKGWRMMFADKEIDRMRTSLGRTRDALRMSSLVFQWSLGTARTDTSIGIGYAGLAAALDRMAKGRSIVGLPPSKSFEAESSIEIEDAVMPPIAALPPASLVDSSAPSENNELKEEASNHAKLLPEIRSHTSISNISVADAAPRTDHRHASGIRSAGGSSIRKGPVADDTFSAVITETDTWIDELENLELVPGGNKVLRLKADPLTQPRWTPRNVAGANAGTLKTALVSAVHDRKHKMMEQILDRGISPDDGLDSHVLRDAALNQDPEAVRLLLLFGADPNRPDPEDGVTALFSAVHVSFPEGAKMMLKYGADPNLAVGLESESPLAIAVLQGKIGFVKLLLIYGGNANQILTNGNPILIECITKTSQKKLVDLILDYGADANAKNREGKSALFEAINAGRHDLVASLLDHGANPNLPGPKHMLWPAVSQPLCLKILLHRGADHKKTPGVMELATSTNNLESIGLLLKAGCDPNAKKDGTWTPLCTSIRDDRADIFKLLLANGADPNLPSAEYPCFKCVTHFRPHFLPPLVSAGGDIHTPPGILETAVQVNNPECFDWLLDQGVDPNTKSPAGHTPLTTAIRENRGAMLERLLARGADPNVRGEDWPICMAVRRPAVLRRLLPCVPDPGSFKGVLERAVVAGEIESIRLLLAAGVSVEDKNGGVFSPLTTAIREDRKDIVRFLLDEGGADPNAVGEHLPIVKAVRRCRGDDTEIIEMLLARGADVNKTYRGWNAVMQAVENGDGKVLRLLAKKGVDLEQKDDAGRTVMSIAVGRGWEEAVSILVANGKATGPLRR